MTATQTTDLSVFNRIELPRTVSFWRVLQAEARKAVDTRPMIILHVLSLGSIVAIALGMRYLNLQFGGGEIGWQTFGIYSMSLSIYFLAVISTLIVTSEWSAKTGLVTYSLEPRRYRVIAAKFLVATAISLLSLAFAYLVGIFSFGVAGPAFSLERLGYDVTNIMALVAMAFAFALLLRNAAATIVIFFVMPIVINSLTFAGGTLGKIVPWLDLAGSLDTIFVEVTASTVGHAVVATSVWIVIPMVLGLILNQRAEIK